jgi:hypothetical protein
MILPLAYSMSYGAVPAADQVQFRFWLFIFLLSSPALVVYAVSKIEGDEFKISVFSWVFWFSILIAMIVPTVGPPNVSVPMLAVLVLCGSAELLRYGWWEKIKGGVGLLLSGFALGGVVHAAFPHFMMTGRIF